MPAPVELVTIHHEGAGAPRSFPGGAWPYTYWLGAGDWHRIQTPWTSWGTLHYNHVSLDVCLSGNREPNIGEPAFPVTVDDLAQLTAIIADARAVSFVVGNPLVRAHRYSPGSNTVCPGDNTMARWGQIAAICAGTPAPPPQPIQGGPLTTLYTTQHSPNGRVAGLYPVPALNVVIGRNGGKLDGAQSSGDNWVWKPNDHVVSSLPNGRLVDIGKVNANTIAATYDLGDGNFGTYEGTVSGGNVV